MSIYATVGLTEGGVQARDVDEVMAAQEAYLKHIIEQALMDARTESLRDTLSAIFDCCHQLVRPLQVCSDKLQASSHTLTQHVAQVRTPPRVCCPHEAVSASQHAEAVSASQLVRLAWVPVILLVGCQWHRAAALSRHVEHAAAVCEMQPAAWRQGRALRGLMPSR